MMHVLELTFDCAAAQQPLGILFHVCVTWQACQEPYMP